jgi:oligogalacturonide lyase
MSCRIAQFVIVALLTIAPSPLLHAQQQQALPRTWIDKDTGHRVFRLSDEAGSSGFYFNVNAYSPDGRWMVYTAPDGIHTFELATKKTRLLVPNPPPPAGEQPSPRSGLHTIVVGKKTNSVFYSIFDSTANASVLYKADLDSGAVTKLIVLPARVTVSTINADETLAAGSIAETAEAEAHDPSRRNTHTSTDAAGRPVPTPLVQAADKSQMMEQRLAAHIPVILFTIDLRTGKMNVLLHSTDWIGHMLFSPADPALLMYCHEGPWHKVDRIWMIRTDGSENRLIHKRTMLMEIAGHEFWGLDGETIWYDWQTPKGEDFWLAGYNLRTHRRVAYHMQRDEWSIHFNLTSDLSLFAGDGGDSGQVAHSQNGTWIELFHPEMRRNEDGLDSPDFVVPGVFHSEHLVNMANHNYRLEPNVRISPDKKMVFFTSNMFGPSYVFGVETEKTVNPNPDEVISTAGLGRRFAQTPTPTPDDK